MDVFGGEREVCACVEGVCVEAKGLCVCEKERKGEGGRKAGEKANGIMVIKEDIIGRSKKGWD